MLKKYLVISSVIFHLLILGSLFWIVPFFYTAFDTGSEWAAASENSEIGLVKDVAILSREGVTHIGYEIELDGKTIYLSGAPNKKYKVNDKVELFISEHPYGALNTLMVTILGVHRSLADQ